MDIQKYYFLNKNIIYSKKMQNLQIFCKRLCWCFDPTKSKKKRLQSLDENFVKNKNNQIATELNEKEELSSEPIFVGKFAKFLNKAEKEAKVNYSEKDVVENLEKYFQNNENFKKIYEKNDLFFYCKEEGSELSKDTILLKMHYKLPKEAFGVGTTIKQIASYIKNGEHREQWDVGLKKQDTLDEFANFDIFRRTMNKPAFFISERDFVDKRIDLFYNKKYYKFNSSVDFNIDEKYKEREGIVRGFTYIDNYSIEEEGDFFLFKSITQVDFKIPAPTSLIGLTAGKIVDWYKNLGEYCKKQGVEEESEDEKASLIEEKKSEGQNNEDDSSHYEECYSKMDSKIGNDEENNED